MIASEERVSSVSKSHTLEEMGEFWDTHSLADYWDQTEEVEVHVLTQRKRKVTVDPDVYDQVAARARQRGLLPETVINLWLADRLHQLSEVERAGSEPASSAQASPCEADKAATDEES